MKRLMLILLLLLLADTGAAFAQMRGYRYAPPLRSWRIGVEGGVSVLGGDLTRESQDYHFRPNGGVELALVPHRNFAVGVYADGVLLRSTSAERESNTRLFGGGLLLELRAPLLRGSLFPVLQARAGGVLVDPEMRIGAVTYEGETSRHMAYSLAAGFEAISYRRFGIRLLVGVTYTTTDRLDFLLRGDDNDAYSHARLSLHYYITRRR